LSRPCRRGFGKKNDAIRLIDRDKRRKIKTMYQLIKQFQTTTLCLLMLALGCFAFSPTVRAVDPAPDGGYPNQNTAEGEDALFSLTTGADNAAMGFDALDSNTTGSNNALA